MTTTSIQRTDPEPDASARDAANRVWTIQAVRDLGTTTDIETAAEVLGIGRTKAYELAKTDQFPVKVLHIGRRYVVPVPGILQVLGADCRASDFVAGPLSRS